MIGDAPKKWSAEMKSYYQGNKNISDIAHIFGNKQNLTLELLR